MRSSPIALALLLTVVAAPSALMAQPSPPQRPGQAVPQDKAENPAAPQRRPPASLETLFQRLHDAKTPEEAKGIATQIQRRWARSGSDTADLLMTRAQEAIRNKQTEIAVELLDRIISLQPDWAEAWNQRANALYIAGDPIRSLYDIGETLRREPRHYGAIMGLGIILKQQGDDKAAMAAFRRALDIYPQFEAVKKAVDSLRYEVDGRET
ncbi:tetratricopeptide repeat protein [Bosea sp. TND4EK4]|uniref:tetratricopeptide repeat protein n=1 Tax=Bosea sp. TND4EK4 TaxID=1907408 RepID=UPI0009570D1E|nr:tetratricopeptide repeat protein [Bosea sp. TND4EK4]SIR03289.1 Tetratricopeptide repeat-containing protein [Bosea sp. TND4EK4]